MNRFDQLVDKIVDYRGVDLDFIAEKHHDEYCDSDDSDHENIPIKNSGSSSVGDDTKESTSTSSMSLGASTRLSYSDLFTFKTLINVLRLHLPAMLKQTLVALASELTGSDESAAESRILRRTRGDDCGTTSLSRAYFGANSTLGSDDVAQSHLFMPRSLTTIESSMNTKDHMATAREEYACDLRHRMGVPNVDPVLLGLSAPSIRADETIDHRYTVLTEGRQRKVGQDLQFGMGVEDVELDLRLPCEIREASKRKNRYRKLLSRQNATVEEEGEDSLVVDHGSIHVAPHRKVEAAMVQVTEPLQVPGYLTTHSTPSIGFPWSHATLRTAETQTDESQKLMSTDPMDGIPIGDNEMMRRRRIHAGLKPIPDAHSSPKRPRGSRVGGGTGFKVSPLAYGLENHLFSRELVLKSRNRDQSILKE
eukprot:Selendium_serpulae@DN7988_c0_g1_i1.p1